MEDIASWAISSLGVGAVNDFVSPAAILTALLASLLGRSSKSYQQSPGLPFYLTGSTHGVSWGNESQVPWGNRTVTGTDPQDAPNTGSCSVENTEGF